jgi:hypothetical protein
MLKIIDAKLCENSQGFQYPVVRRDCPPANTLAQKAIDQVTWLFYPVPNQPNQYYIQSKLK